MSKVETTTLSIPIRELSDWADFVTIADKLDFGEMLGQDSAVVFRGQEDFEWRLKPTLQRAAANDGVRELPAVTKLLHLENQLTRKFKAFAPIICHTGH
jgi:hypothetical protein